MKEISIALASPTPGSSLYPKYDNEANVLEVTSREERVWTSGIDIDGRIIFDVDKHGMLCNFDLLIPKRLWKVTELIRLPPDYQAASLILTQETLSQKSFHMPLTVVTNEAKSHVFIVFGDRDFDESWIALSPVCLALVTKKHNLRGFFLVL